MAGLAAREGRDGPAVRAWIGLGANLGDAAAAIESAVSAIARLPGTRLAARSSLWRRAPLDAAGDDYRNAVAGVDTTLAAAALLAGLQSIEASHGRTRPFRHAPRTLDLDLLLYGDDRIDEPGLVVPHPRLHERAFVLAPLAEVAPDLAVPGRGRIAELLAGVGDQRVAKLDR